MRDKILAMEAGKLLDSMIAEDVMGWHLGDSWGGEDWHTKDHEFAESVFRFKPSTEITSAWEVVEKLKDTHWIDASVGLALEHLYMCKIGKLSAPGFIYAYGETAPEAICKAALLSVMNS